MDKITRDQIKKDFEHYGIHGGRPVETEQMLNNFAALLNMAFRSTGINRQVETPARERTEETMCAMKTEIQQLLDKVKTETIKEENLSNVTLSLLGSISSKERPIDEFFSLIELLQNRPDAPILTVKYGFNLELTDSLDDM